MVPGRVLASVAWSNLVGPLASIPSAATRADASTQAGAWRG